MKGPFTLHRLVCGMAIKTTRPKCLLFFTIWCLFLLTIPRAGNCQPAFDQLQEAAGQQQGNIPDPGAPVCVGCGLKNGIHTKDCPYANKKSMSSKTADPAIVGMLAKQRRLEYVLAETLREIDQDIQKCDNNIALAKTIITKAQNTGKIEAEVLARQNLIKAQKLKQSRLEKKRITEQQLNLAKEMEGKLSRALMDK